MTDEELRQWGEEFWTPREPVERACQDCLGLLDNMPDGYLITDAAGTIQHANRAAVRLLSTSQKGPVGKSLVNFVIKEERRSFRSELNRLRQAEQEPEWSVRLRPRSGVPVDAALTVGAVRDMEGKPIAFLWRVREVTEQQRADAALGEDERRFRSLADSIPIGIFRTDVERQCIYTNARWQAITGLTPAESLGYGWSRLLHPDDREAVLKAWARAAREGREFSYDHRIVTPQAVVRWVHLRSTALLSPEGNLTGYICAVDDITERKRAEEELHASEQRFRALTEHSWDGISLIAADGTILYDNPAASSRILGYATGELVGRNAFDRLHPEDWQPVTDLFAQVLQQPGGSATGEFRYQHKDGSWPWIECTGTNLLREPSVQAIVTNYRDITDRKRAEEEIRRRHRELAALNVITTAVSSSLEVPRVLASFKRLVAEELGAPGGVIFLRDAANDRLSALVDSWGLPEVVLAGLTKSRMTAPHYEWVAQKKTALLVPDFREVPLFYSLRLDVARPEWQSYLCIPLLANGEVRGVVSLFSQAPTPFSEDQLPFFEALGQQFGVAIQNATLFEQVRAWRERLQALSHRLVELQETERQHIARELHDEVGQLLTGLRLTLEMSTRLPAETLSESLAEAVALVNELIARVRELSLDLRPAMLDDLGLMPALLWHFERYTAQTGVRVVFQHMGLEGRFPAAVEIAAYRIVQEALTNVARHASVGEVTVHLWAGHGILSVRVRDEGTGFDPGATSPGRTGCGLTGMRERATLLGGELLVESAPGTGACLTAELPLDDPVVQKRSLHDDYSRS